MKRFILIILFLFCLSGCGLLGSKVEKDLNEAQQRVVVVNAELDEKNRQLTTGIVDLSEHKKQTTADNYLPIDELINTFAKENQRIVGLPIERIDIIALLEQYKMENEKILKELEKEREQTTLWLKEKRQLNDSISVLTKKLKEEENRSIFSIIWGWTKGLSLSGIILLIVGLVFAPTITIPLLGKIFSWLISFVPQIISFFGIVGKSMFDEVVMGVQKTREKIKNDPDDKTYTKKEIQSLIDTQLAMSTNDSTKKVISHRKTALKMKNIA